MELHILAQQLVNGLVLGATYGLIAVGYTMVYGIIGMINFAHGDVYMIAAYLSAIFLAVLLGLGVSHVWLAILLAFVFVVVVTGAYGYAIEKVAYKPLRGSGRLSPLISAIGMSLVLQNYVQISQGARSQGIPSLIPGSLEVSLGSGSVMITYVQLMIFAVSIISMAILAYIIKYTSLGRACRATQQDIKMASILGVS